MADTDNPGADDTLDTVAHNPSSAVAFEHEPLIEITRADRLRKYREDTKHLTVQQRWWQWFLKKWAAFLAYVLPTRRRVIHYLRTSFPIFDTIRSYPQDWRTKLLGDVIAGLSIATILIPQVISYANVAGLPPVYGLYSSFVPMAMYLVLGSSHHLNVAPVAVLSLVVNQSILNITTYAADPNRYVACAIFLTMLTGIWQIGFGVLNIGFLLRLISPAFIAAFVTASAFTIGSTQLGNLFGFSVANSSFIWRVIIDVCNGLGQTQWLAPTIGLPCLAIILFVRRRYPLIPVAFILVVVFTFVSWCIIHYNNAYPKWPVTGNIPAGLPSFLVPSVSANDALDLVAPSLICTFIGYMESYSLAVKMGEKHGYRVNGNQEFIALGVANLVGSFFQAYPVTGSFSRTAEADLQGARTILYSLVSIIAVIISLLFVTPAFYYIPKSILAAVILAAVYRLIDFETMVKYYHTSTVDFLIWWATFIGVIAGGTENGIAVGIAFSIVALIFQHMFPYIAYLGKATGPDGKIKLLNIKRFPQAKADPNVLIMRFDHSLVFLNKDYFQEKVETKTTPAAESADPDTRDAPDVAPKVFILDGSAIHHVDIFGAEALLNITRKLRARGITPLFAYLRSNVKDVLIDSGIMDEINHKSFFVSVEDAVDAANAIVRGESPSSVLERNNVPAAIAAQAAEAAAEAEAALIKRSQSSSSKSNKHQSSSGSPALVTPESSSVIEMIEVRSSTSK